MTLQPEKKKPRNPVRARVHEIIFEADTRAGRLFDIVLIWVILLSVVAVMLNSVAAVQIRYGNYLRVAEGHDDDARHCKKCGAGL